VSGRAHLRLARILAGAALFVLAACGGGAQTAGVSAPATLKLGYFANLTHATALIGLRDGVFEKALGPDVSVQSFVFNAGPAAVEALLSGSIDASYVGPNPAINAFVQSHGTAVRIISGATSGGAALVVKPSIRTAADLRGRKLSSPQLGNTQDVALRWWLQSNGLKTSPQGGGDLTIIPQDSSQTLQAFKTGDIDGAWVPEPWATRLVLEGKGKVLVDERALWPQGRFATSQLVVRTDFLKRHRDLVRRLLQGQVQTTALLNDQSDQSRAAASDALAAISGSRLSDAVLAQAWSNLTFANDPVAASLQTSADHAQQLGLLKSADLKGIYDLTLLNEVLGQEGQAPVPTP